MIPIEQIQDREVQALARRAQDFLSSHRWCKSITSGHLAWSAGRLLAVFKLHFEPAEPDVDTVLWVVVGDVPPAYIVLDDAPTWQEALARYVEEMSRWVENVRTGQDLEGVIPVDVEPTPEHAEMLASRLAIIRSQIIDANPATLESDA